MPKYIIKEGVMSGLIQKLFTLVGTGDERKALNTVLGKDPELKKDLQNLTKLRKKIEKNFEKKTKNDPDRRKALDRIRNL